MPRGVPQPSQMRSLVVRNTNWGNGLAFSRLAEREAGSAIDLIDDGHVLNRVFRRRLHRFAAQHRRCESVKLIRVRGAPREALYTFAFG